MLSLGAVAVDEVEVWIAGVPGQIGPRSAAVCLWSVVDMGGTLNATTFVQLTDQLKMEPKRIRARCSKPVQTHGI